LTPYMSAKRMHTFLPFFCIFGVRKNARLKEKFYTLKRKNEREFSFTVNPLTYERKNRKY